MFRGVGQPSRWRFEGCALDGQWGNDLICYHARNDAIFAFDLLSLFWKTVKGHCGT